MPTYHKFVRLIHNYHLLLVVSFYSIFILTCVYKPHTFITYFIGVNVKPKFILQIEQLYYYKNRNKR